MAATSKTKEKAEYGDFQTPLTLATQICELLVRKGLQPAAILEPTCGLGNFLFAAAATFPAAVTVIGVEINASYVAAARAGVAQLQRADRVQVTVGDFFTTQWPDILCDLPDPLLVIGNLPWVTNAALGGLGSDNLPQKQNAGALTGIAAVTGKSNFDISEWMLQQILRWVDGRSAAVAMLCKSAVARKVLAYAWSNAIAVSSAAIYRIDAETHFGATVDACLLVLHTSAADDAQTCQDYALLEDAAPQRSFGMRAGRLVADIGVYERWQHLDGVSPRQWRSGIKHDCAQVMELRLAHNHLCNGLGEQVDVEPDFVYPMRKSSQLTKTVHPEEHRFMLVPQRAIGEDTRAIQHCAPSTWRYLTEHGAQLDKRASRIYRGQPRFAIFGVGAYTFALWKVAISGFYKQLDFRVIGPHAGKPVVLDDTCYFLACATETEANLLARLLNSRPAQEFLGSLIFWDAKRPITGEILGRLDLQKVADELDLSPYDRDLLLANGPLASSSPTNIVQGALFSDV